MSENDAGITPLHPPTSPPPMRARPARPGGGWPRVIGIVAIIYGAFSIMGAAWYFVSAYLMSFVRESLPEDQTGAFQTFEVFEKWKAMNFVSSAMSIVLAVLLLEAGFGLIKRLRGAARLGVIWAVLKFFFVIAQSALVFAVQRESSEVMRNQGGPAIAGKFSEFAAFVSTGLTLLWGWSLPVFWLIWFNRAKIKREIGDWS